MKKTIILLFTLSLFFQLKGQTKESILNPDPFQAGSSTSSIWNTESGKWEKSTKNKLVLNNGILERLLTLDYLTGDTIKQVLYSYFFEGDYTIQLFQSKFDGEWVNYRRNFWYYNESGQNIDVIIQFFRNDSWVNVNRYFEYTYSNDQLVSYENQSWEGDFWRSHSFDNWYYNDDGFLILRQRETLSGSFVYQIIYDLNEDNQRKVMTTQLWQNNGWVDRNRRVYSYNDCGKTSNVIYQNYIDGEWINNTMTEYQYEFNPHLISGRKVAICHNGHTIYVSKNAVRAHLAHGDCLGECEQEKKHNRENERERTKIKDIPFRVYPNPARERLRVKFDHEKCDDLQRVELVDPFGKTLKSYKVTGKRELTIPRGNLKNGSYYLKVTGDEVYSTIVIFK